MPLGAAAIAAIAGGGTALASNLGNLFTSSHAQNKQRDIAIQLMQEEQSYNERNMLLAPKLQAQGLREAGINPASQGTSATGNLASAPSPSLGSYPNTGFNIDNLSNVAQLLQQQKLVESQTELNKATADKTRHDDTRASDYLSTQLELMESQIGLNNFDLSKLKPKQAEEIQSKIETLNAQKEQLVQSLDNMKATCHLTNQQAQQVAALTQQCIKEIAWMDRRYKAEITSLYAGSNASNSSANANNALAGVYGEQKRLVGLQADTQNYTKDLSKNAVLQAHIDLKMKNFEWQLKDALGVNYYKYSQYWHDFSQGVKDVGVGVGGAVVAAKGLKTQPSGPLTTKLQQQTLYTTPPSDFVFPQ